MVGLENLGCGCVFDSSPAAWLHACEEHHEKFVSHKRGQRVVSDLWQDTVMSEKRPPTREEVDDALEAAGL